MKNHIKEVLKTYSSSWNYNELSKENIPEGKVDVIEGNRNRIIITNDCKTYIIERNRNIVKEGNQRLVESCEMQEIG